MITGSNVLRTSMVKCVCIYSIESEWRVEYGVSNDFVDLPGFFIAGILEI